MNSDLGVAAAVNAWEKRAVFVSIVFTVLSHLTMAFVSFSYLSCMAWGAWFILAPVVAIWMMTKTDPLLKGKFSWKSQFLAILLFNLMLVAQLLFELRTGRLTFSFVDVFLSYLNCIFVLEFIKNNAASQRNATP